MERQELILMGVLTLQQQLYGAPRRQGDAGGGEPAAEAAGRPARLWQQFTVLLWCHELPAHSHLWNLLPPACCTHFHDLEQVGHDPLRSTCPRLCRWCGLWSSGAATAADGPLPTRVTVLDGDEDLPLRKAQQWPSRVHSGPMTERLIWSWKSLTVWLSSALSVCLRVDQSLSYGFWKCWKYAHQSGKMSVLLVCSRRIRRKSISEWKQGLLQKSVDLKKFVMPRVTEGRAGHVISWPFKIFLFDLFSPDLSLKAEYQGGNVLVCN